MIAKEQKTLLWDQGPVSFGNLVADEIVSWSANGSYDLLLSRCWQGVYLYPSKDLSDSEQPDPCLSQRRLHCICDDGRHFRCNV